PEGALGVGRLAGAEEATAVGLARRARRERVERDRDVANDVGAGAARAIRAGDAVIAVVGAPIADRRASHRGRRRALLGEPARVRADTRRTLVRAALAHAGTRGIRRTTARRAGDGTDASDGARLRGKTGEDVAR